MDIGIEGAAALFLFQSKTLWLAIPLGENHFVDRDLLN